MDETKLQKLEEHHRHVVRTLRCIAEQFEKSAHGADSHVRITIGDESVSLAEAYRYAADLLENIPESQGR